MPNILVTGTAGFIGFHVARRLLGEGWQVTGLDNINPYYDPAIKYDRLKATGIAPNRIVEGKPVDSDLHPGYTFIKGDLEDKALVESIFASGNFDRVCHLAAQAGVRYSIENPHAYINSNITGFMNILEGCRQHHVNHLVYASSSSVYGMNEILPLSEHRGVDHPVSLYAATKRSNELMAHAYSHLYGIPTTGLRFFTVYGPWGRPDMALFIFTRAILGGQPVVLFNHGRMLRDFTYIDDIVEGVTRVLNSVPVPDATWDPQSPDPATSKAPFRIYNIGHSNPVELTDFVDAIEEKLGKKGVRNYLPMQPGDVPRTYSDVSGLEQDFGYCPATGVKEGIARFIDWYLAYYGEGGGGKAKGKRIKLKG